MNLIQQAEQLKNLPDQALAQMQQRPTEVPPYLVVAEMTRRTNMRKAYQATQTGSPMNQPTVVQQMGQNFAQQGQPPPQGMPPGMASQGAPPPMRMAGGGIADLSQYFQGMGMQGPSMLPQVDPAMMGGASYPGDPRWDEMRRFKVNPQKPADWKTQLAMMKEQMGESPLVEEAAKYGEQEKELRSKKMSLPMLLMQLGLGMAASRRPDFAGAIGEGGMQALQGYTSERDRNTALADRAGAKRLQAIEGSQRHSDRIQDYAVDAARSAQSGYNTDRASDTNIELGIMRQQKEEELATKLADRQITAQQAQLELAEFNKKADADRRMAEIQAQITGNKEVARIRNEGKANKGGKDTTEKDKKEKITQLASLARQLDMSASGLDKAAAGILNPNDPQKKVFSQQAQEARQKAKRYRDQLESLMSGEVAPKAKSNAVGDIVKMLIGDFTGASRQPSKPPPLVIPPPPR